MISKRLSSLSSSEESFNEVIRNYKAALEKSDTSKKFLIEIQKMQQRKDVVNEKYHGITRPKVQMFQLTFVESFSPLSRSTFQKAIHFTE